MLPMLYGILAAWVLTGAMCVLLLSKFTALGVWTMLILSSLFILCAVIPATSRAAWQYSNMRRYHSAEYFYDLGNRVEVTKAIHRFEQRANKALWAWVKRHMLKPTMNGAFLCYLVAVTESAQWVRSLWVFVAFLLLIVAVEVSTWVMLLVARKISYDKYGNLKNN